MSKILWYRKISII